MFLHIFPYSANNMNVELIKFIFKTVLKFIFYIILTFSATQSSLALFILLGLIFINVKESVKTAFSDPEDINYERKTDKELFTFLFNSCITAFLFALISFQIFLYIALLFWFYFVIFILMFSRVWRFHGKKRIYLFTIIIAVTVLSLIVAPNARNAIYIILNFFNVY